MRATLHYNTQYRLFEDARLDWARPGDGGRQSGCMCVHDKPVSPSKARRTRSGVRPTRYSSSVSTVNCLQRMDVGQRVAPATLVTRGHERNLRAHTHTHTHLLLNTRAQCTSLYRLAFRPVRAVVPAWDRRSHTLVALRAYRKSLQTINQLSTRNCDVL